MITSPPAQSVAGVWKIRSVYLGTELTLMVSGLLSTSDFSIFRSTTTPPVRFLGDVVLGARRSAPASF